MKATARANTNIALIKYWGKRDEALILPMNNSISITLDQFYTTTKVEFSEVLREDTFTLNGQPGEHKDQVKVSKFLDLVRKKAGIDLFAKVTSENRVPTAAGLASSASGYAALAAAAAKAAGLDLERQELSKLARRGSGSACRSVYGGFVEWEKGSREDGEDSYAKPLLSEEDWRLTVLSVIVQAGEKKVSSREGMKRTVETSAFYPGWLESVEIDLVKARKAIESRNINKLGMVMESNAMKMHATTLGAYPPFTYWESGTLAVMREVEKIRVTGVPAYFTIDAGPNVKVLCLPEDEQFVMNRLAVLPEVEHVHLCRPGSGVTYLEDSEDL